MDWTRTRSNWWHERSARARRHLTSIAVLIGYGVGMWVLVAVPAGLFLDVTRGAGANVGGNLQLSPVGFGLSFLVFATVFMWSIAVGGCARLFMRPAYFDWPWLMSAGLVVLLTVTFLFNGAREAVSQLHASASNSNAIVAAFFAFWLLMVGYAAKAVWDEARDRFAGYLERKIVADRRAPLCLVEEARIIETPNA